MDTATMSSNGNKDHSEPDLVYDSLNPIRAYGCSGADQHVPACDGTCESRELTENDIEFINEMRAWDRAGMNIGNIRAVPALIEVDQKLYERIFINKFGIDPDELEQMRHEVRMDYFRKIRTENEERIRKERVKRMVAVRNSKLLGPDGRSIL